MRLIYQFLILMMLAFRGQLDWKTSYYQNTNDMKTDEVEEDKPDLQDLIGELSNANEEECESCAI